MPEMKDWNILVVEDEPDGQEVVNGILGYFGINSVAVDSAEDALTLLGQGSFTAAVIDLMLPNMDGLGLVKAIRGRPAIANLPCIAMTAYHTSLVRQQALDAGFDAYFPKPLDDTTFVRELDRIIGHR